MISNKHDDDDDDDGDGRSGLTFQVCHIASPRSPIQSTSTCPTFVPSCRSLQNWPAVNWNASRVWGILVDFRWI